MPTTYDITTDIGKVRLLCRDTDVLNAMFDDAEIQAFLDLEGNNVKLAAAQALDTIASNEALVSKRIRLLDLDLDGPAVAKALRDAAASLRTQVADAQADAESGDAFDWAEMVIDPFSERERIIAEGLRDG